MSMPSKAAIAAHWSTVAELFADGEYHCFDMDSARCWACDLPETECGSIERAHLVPRSLGGPDEASNLVLLCSSCHRKAPNTDDAAFMLEWVRSYADREFARLDQKAREVLKLLQSRLGVITDELAERIAPGSPGADRVQELLAERSSYHYGDTTNVATFAWAIEQVLTA